MHLLPHKSWNVWSAKNKEKVLRDEREHELKLQEQKRRQIEIVCYFQYKIPNLIIILNRNQKGDTKD